MDWIGFVKVLSIRGRASVQHLHIVTMKSARFLIGQLGLAVMSVGGAKSHESAARPMV